MSDVNSRDLAYALGETRMLGYFCSDAGPESQRAGILMIHGGFGLVPRIMDNARRLASLGYPVLAVDLWGERQLPADASEFVPMIKTLADDRATWMGRLDAAREALLAQPEVAAAPIAAVGYCFGGSSVLEYARAGRELAAVVSLHGGLDTVGLDWSQCPTSTSIMILTGAEDPMAPPAQLALLENSMSANALDWEANVYSGTDHAFSFPDSPNYRESSDRRSWLAMTRLLAERLSSA